jgi:putrescine importer
MATNPGTTTSSTPRLRRTLTLSDLILYGIIVIQPVAPMSVFGVLSDRGKGHVVTAILIAMVAMLFTAISYGRMARAYPSAGSAFTYVAQEINPAMGYVTGWSMVMDYMLNPLICTVWCAGQASQFAPGVPSWIWKIFFVLVFTLLNIRGYQDFCQDQHRHGDPDGHGGGSHFRGGGPVHLWCATWAGLLHAAIL